MEIKHLHIYRGDDKSFLIPLRDAQGEPAFADLPLTEADIRVTIIPENRKERLVPLVAIRGNGSSILLNFPGALTRDIEWTRADYDIKIVRGITKTIQRGKLFVRKDVRYEQS